MSFDEKKRVKVASGSLYSLILSASGKVYSIGNNSDGKNGLGFETSKPTLIKTLENEVIVDIDTLFHTSYFITKSGNLYTCGSNGNGQALHYSSIHKTIRKPLLVKSLLHEKVKKISSGDFHVIVLCSNNSMYSGGTNGSRQCVTFNEHKIPYKITFFKENSIFVKEIDCSTNTSFFIDSKGDLYSCGSSSVGKAFNKLGNGIEKLVRCIKFDKNGGAVCISTGFSHFFVMTKDGNVFGGGDSDMGTLAGVRNGIVNGVVNMKKYFSSVNLFNNKSFVVKRIWAEGNNSFCETSEGLMYGFGRNNSGQLMVLSPQKKCFVDKKNVLEPKKFCSELLHQGVHSISVGYYHGVCVTKKWKLYYFGVELKEKGFSSFQTSEIGCVLEEMKDINIMDVKLMININRNAYIDLIIKHL